MIEPKETWSVTDPTKLQSYMTCPRMYFFEYVLGWRGAEPSVHLEHGIAVHKAMECFYPAGGRPDFSGDAIANACGAYYEHYSSVFSIDQFDENAPKNPACTWRALEQYADFYRDIDRFAILHTEVAGSVLLDENRRMHFKQDLICRDDDTGRVFSLEHKTSTSFRPIWAMEWSQKVQAGCYSHVLFCMYPPEEVYGIRINGIFVHKPPQMKLDGTMRAGAKDNEFHRVPVAKTPDQMQDWLNMVSHWLEQLDVDFETMMLEQEAEFMTAFPKNTESCTKYFGCAFQPFCAAWHNPLQHCDEIPVGFKEEHWDPRSKELEAKEVVEL